MFLGSDVLREHLIFALDILRKRWLLILAPIAAAIALALVAVEIAPTKYSASSLIMLQAANRTPGGIGGPQQGNTVEQMLAVEAWLKSDEVLAEIVPQMTGYEAPDSEIAKLVQMKLLAASLSLEMVGNSVIRIKMEGAKPEGLGHNLEVVLSRLMEGLTGPEQNIFSAPQFVQMRRSEDTVAAETALMRAIEALDVQAPMQIRTQLHQIWAMTHNSRNASGMSPSSGDAGSYGNDVPPNTVANLRHAISTDPAKIAELEALYAAYQDATDKEAEFKARAGQSRSNYVSIFNSPDDLLVVGRPKDPIAGESSARKLAIAGVLLSIVLGFGLAIVSELLGGVLRTRKEYETVSGLPVLARIPKLHA